MICKYDGCLNDARRPYTNKGKDGYTRTHTYHDCSNCAHHVSKYGISIPERDKMLANQNHICLVCVMPIEFGKRGSASVDHCHDTGVIRGILCSNCNSAIGLLKEDRYRFEAAMRYLDI